MGQIRFPFSTILAGLLLLVGPAVAHADTYTFSCPESTVKGFIHYSVVGVYHGQFNDCSGKIIYDPSDRLFKSVEIKIKAASIVSPLQWCDNVVKSRRVLDIKKYPFITFKSSHFVYHASSCQVYGKLALHGFEREMDSSFEIEKIEGNVLVLKGNWTFNRKKFHVIWSKILDHGGLVVGDDVKVDWAVKAHKI